MELKTWRSRRSQRVEAGIVLDEVHYKEELMFPEMKRKACSLLFLSAVDLWPTELREGHPLVFRDGENKTWGKQKYSAKRKSAFRGSYWVSISTRFQARRLSSI